MHLLHQYLHAAIHACGMCISRYYPALITLKESTEALQRLAEQRLLSETVRSGTERSGTRLSGTRVRGIAGYSNKAVSATPHAHRPFRSAPHLSLPSRDVPVDGARASKQPIARVALGKLNSGWQRGRAVRQHQVHVRGVPPPALRIDYQRHRLSRKSRQVKLMRAPGVSLRLASFKGKCGRCAFPMHA